MKPSERLKHWENLSPSEFVAIRKEVAQLEADNERLLNRLNGIYKVVIDDQIGEIAALQQEIEILQNTIKSSEELVEYLHKFVPEEKRLQTKPSKEASDG